jgi:hypothetical protein
MTRFIKALSWIITLLAATAALYTLYLSIDNPIRADLAMLHYSGYLMQEKHFLLYRDILEINFPAPFLLHQWLGSLLGYEALPLRWLDFVSIGLLAWLSWRILQPFSTVSAVIAPVLFVFFYLLNGAEYTLERDYLLLLPVTAAFLCATSTRLPVTAAACLIGFLCGIACSLKPNAIVAAPALFAVLWLQTPSLHSLSTFVKNALISGCIFLITFSIPFVIIQQQGVLDDFIQLYKTFLPIYANARYDLFHYASREEYWSTLRQNYLHYAGISLLLAAPGLIWAYINTTLRTRLLQLAIMIFAFTLYELIAGKFWASHLLPSAYWSFIGFSLLLTPPQENSSLKQWIALPCLLIVIGVSSVTAYITIIGMQRYYQEQQQGTNRASHVAHYLKQHLKAGDTVQALDFAGDGQASLLAARATSATRFLIDVPLYLQPDSEATQGLRREFMQSLAAKPPTFIVYFDVFLHPAGGNRLREFRELFAFVESRYTPVDVRDGEYTIYQLK